MERPAPHVGGMSAFLPPARPLPLFCWGVFAVLAGLAAFALPPFVIPAQLSAPAYGHPLIGWFALAFANLSFATTWFIQAWLGLLLGLVQPRYGWLLAAFTALLPVLLNAANVVHDCLRSPTSHNLWPFEFVILLIAAFPAFPTALFGTWIRFRVSASPGK
jgi:hypothetical protein